MSKAGNISSQPDFLEDMLTLTNRLTVPDYCAVNSSNSPWTFDSFVDLFTNKEKTVFQLMAVILNFKYETRS